jgi:hypothetical protein
MGLGGFFMHSRVGLGTAYLSEEWFRCIGACVDEARKLGMEAWLYDEDRWPSGAAGGLVTRNPKYRRRRLTWTESRTAREFRWDRDILAAFAIRYDADKASAYRRLKRGEKPKLAAGEVVLAFRVKIEEPSSWYNDQTYLDTMNPAAVREFIRVTHEAYRKRFGKEFGKRIPGIFTDEPFMGHTNIYDDPARSELPWTDALPEVFKARYGYDLVPHLPELLYDVAGAAGPARYHYHDCRTHLFVQAFARQVGEWCGRNKLMFTGHVLEEDNPMRQTNVVGSCMPFYEYMQAPGMDLLTERWRIYDTAKQVSSAARQFGWKWRLTETYGCTGWDFPFRGHKALGDWQVALGINLRCQHLFWYTMSGEAKRDYPAAISHQSPWWEQYAAVEDYFARTHAVMTRGVEVRDLLVVHPVESAWMRVRKNWRTQEDLKAINRGLCELRDALLCQHVDFDYGEESLLARHGRVRRGTGGLRLVVGKAEYRAVVVPPMITMRSTTVELLRRFRQAGGKVVFAGPVATHLDGVPSPLPAQFAAECPKAPAKGPKLAASVAECRRISILDERGNEIPSALYLLREDAAAWYLFLCNTGHSRAQLGIEDSTYGDVMARDRRTGFERVTVTASVAAEGAPQEWDAATGERFAASAARGRDGAWRIATALPAAGSRLFVIPKKRGAELPPRPEARTLMRSVIRQPRWEYSLSEANVVVFDQPRCRINRGPWREATDCHLLDRVIRGELGVRHRGGAMVQPWARKPSAPGKSIPVTLEYALEVKDLPSGALEICMERPQWAEVAVNGQVIATDNDSGSWVDPSLRRIPIDPALLRTGTNYITLMGDYTEEDGLEIIYLLGNFGVRLRGKTPVLTALPARLKFGDWTRQGLPFYSGSVAYHVDLRTKAGDEDRLVVKVPDYRGVAVRVLVDGRPAGIAAWEPYEVDITDALTGTRPARLTFEVLGHRRNSHGPFHYKDKWPVWTGPGQFVPGEKDFHAAMQLVPCGLMRPPVIETRQRGPVAPF